MKSGNSGLIAIAAVFILSASSCDKKNETAANTIKACASSDLVKTSQILYTGPVGSGPGARWIVYPNGPSIIAADAKDIFGKEIPEAIADRPASGANCNLNNTKKIDFGLDLGVSISTLPVSADLKSKIGNTANVTSTIDGFEWQSIKVDVYNKMISDLPDSSPYKRPGPGRMTAVAMLRVKGYTATVDVSSQTDLGLGVGYKGPLPSSLVGDVQGKVQAAVTTTGKLVISVPGEVYIAGIFRPIDGGTGKTESSKESTPTENEWKIRPVEVNARRL
jgi:hypothetical protein